MSGVLIDSNVLIAIYDSDDTHHQRAIADLTSIEESKKLAWITEYVLAETATILIKRGMAFQLADIYSKILGGKLQIFQPKTTSDSWKILHQTLERLLKQGNIHASFPDLHQVVVVEGGFLAETQILSYDHHLQ